jgi:hypothetical protein
LLKSAVSNPELTIWQGILLKAENQIVAETSLINANMAYNNSNYYIFKTITFLRLVFCQWLGQPSKGYGAAACRRGRP